MLHFHYATHASELGAGPDGVLLSPGHSQSWMCNSTLLTGDQTRETHTCVVNIINPGFLALPTLDVWDPVTLRCGVSVLFIGDV